MRYSTERRISELFGLSRRDSKSLLKGTIFIDNTQIIMQTPKVGEVRICLREYHWNGTSKDEIFHVVKESNIDSETVKACREKINKLLDDSYKISRTYDKPEVKGKKYAIVKAIF